MDRRFDRWRVTSEWTDDGWTVTIERMDGWMDRLIVTTG